MDEQSFDTPAEVLEACEFTALSYWRDLYASRVRLDDLLGNHIRAVKIGSNRYPGGCMDVMVRIQARDSHQHEVYFWKVHRIMGVYTIT